MTSIIERMRAEIAADQARPPMKAAPVKPMTRTVARALARALIDDCGGDRKRAGQLYALAQSDMLYRREIAVRLDVWLDDDRVWCLDCKHLSAGVCKPARAGLIPGFMPAGRPVDLLPRRCGHHVPSSAYPPSFKFGDLV